MFTGSEDHRISLEEASEMTARYRETITNGETIGGFFGVEIIKSILDQDNCVGIRYYYAINETGKKVLVLTGVNSNGDDLYEGILAEFSSGCPEYCSSPNPLNGL